MKEDQPYYIYILRCEDNSLYTGITTDVKRRFHEHCNDPLKEAKYTRRHKPIKIECVFQTTNRSLASKLEYQIKHLSKIEKEHIIHEELQSIFHAETLDYALYTKIDNEEFVEP